MLYLLIICHDESFVPSEALVGDIHAWNREMERRGVRRDGRPLRPPSDAVTVRVRGDSPVVTDGPFAVSSDQMAAYELVECPSLEDATSVASSHPMARAGSIEVRPVWEELTG